MGDKVVRNPSGGFRFEIDFSDPFRDPEFANKARNALAREAHERLKAEQQEYFRVVDAEELRLIKRLKGGKPLQEREVVPLQATGVSLLDAALILDDGDEELAKEKKISWQKNRTAKPESIGTCPDHRQRKLYEPTAICDWIEKIEGKAICDKYALRERLPKKARAPRTD